MSEVEKLLKLRFDLLSKLIHPWDSILIVDYNEVGTIPEVAHKYKGRVNWQVCDKDLFYEFIFNRVASIDPLFYKTSDEFKHYFKQGLLKSFSRANPILGELGFNNPVNWHEFMNAFFKTASFSGALPWGDPNDRIFWNKINIIPQIDEAMKKQLGSDYHQKYKKAFNKENADLLPQLQKHSNNVNRKVS